MKRNDLLRLNYIIPTKLELLKRYAKVTEKLLFTLFTIEQYFYKHNDRIYAENSKEATRKIEIRTVFKLITQISRNNLFCYFYFTYMFQELKIKEMSYIFQSI